MHELSPIYEPHPPTPLTHGRQMKGESHSPKIQYSDVLRCCLATDIVQNFKKCIQKAQFQAVLDIFNFFFLGPL
jgi:hypothetical protein